MARLGRGVVICCDYRCKWGLGQTDVSIGMVCWVVQMVQMGLSIVRADAMVRLRAKLLCVGRD